MEGSLLTFVRVLQWIQTEWFSTGGENRAISAVNTCCDRKTPSQNTNVQRWWLTVLAKDNTNEAIWLCLLVFAPASEVDANSRSVFMDASPWLFYLWLSEMKCKNNIRRCVPTCLPECIVLQPLQPAAVPMPQVALVGFFIEIEGGFSVSHRCRDKEQLFQPFSQKATLRCGLWKQAV